MLYLQAKKHLDLYEAKLAWLNYVVKRDTYLKTKDALKKETENMMAKQNVKKRHSEKVTRMERQMRELDQLKTQLELTLRRIKEKTDRTREEVRRNFIRTFFRKLKVSKAEISERKADLSRIVPL